MALFRRNKTDNTTAVPQEVSSYYQAESRDRTWMAWLLALVTLAVTAIIIMALFFGGRWAYRKLRHKTGNTTSVVIKPVTAPTTDSTPTSENTSPSNGNGNVNGPANPAPTPNSATPTPIPTPTGKTNLPNTGPGDTLAVFIFTFVLGTALHYSFLSKARSNN